MQSLFDSFTSLRSVFSPDGRYLAVAYSNNDAKVWDLHLTTFVALRGHESSIFSLAFSSDGETIVTAAHDMTLRLWSVKTGQLVKTV
jgi:WD40 repeat protein